MLKKKKKEKEKNPITVCEILPASEPMAGSGFSFTATPWGRSSEEHEQCLLSQGELMFLRALFGSFYPSTVASLWSIYSVSQTGLQ